MGFITKKENFIKHKSCTLSISWLFRDDLEHFIHFALETKAGTLQISNHLKKAINIETLLVWEVDGKLDDIEILNFSSPKLLTMSNRFSNSILLESGLTTFERILQVQELQNVLDIYAVCIFPYMAVWKSMKTPTNSTWKDFAKDFKDKFSDENLFYREAPDV